MNQTFPEVGTNHEAFIAANFEKYHSKLNEKGWVSSIKTPTYELLSKKEPNGYKTIQIHRIMDAPIKQVFDLLFDSSQICKYDPSKLGREDLESGPNYRVLYAKGKGKCLISPRDSCILYGWKEDEKGNFLVTGSAYDHQKAPLVPGRVRAGVSIMAVRMDKVEGDENKTHFKTLASIDPRGLPAFLFNKQMLKQGAVWEAFNEVLKKK